MKAMHLKKIMASKEEKLRGPFKVHRDQGVTNASAQMGPHEEFQKLAGEEFLGGSERQGN